MKDLKTVVIVISAFVAYYILNQLGFAWLFKTLYATWNEKISSFLLAYLLCGSPIFVAAYWLHRRNFIEALGLSSNFFRAFVAAFVFSMPMLVGYASTLSFQSDTSLWDIAKGAVFAGFFEELYFRAFFFGLLFRYTRLGFIPSILSGAVVFGSLHLYQSNDTTQLIGIFMTTFLGAGFFAWVYSEWKYNLWVPIWLHLLMNLYWMLFEAGENALGPLPSNVFRAATIAFTIVATIWLKRKRSERMAVNRHNIWTKTNEAKES